MVKTAAISALSVSLRLTTLRRNTALWGGKLTDNLAALYAKLFIARRDVKAVQRENGDYQPHGRYEGGKAVEYYPFDKRSLLAHLGGEASYGHYLLDTDDSCKLFAFDVDLAETGFLPTRWNDSEGWVDFQPCNPRDAWRVRNHPARGWMKFCFRMVGGSLASAIHSTLNIRTAVAYSGHKGIHVYGFLDKRMQAADARAGAEIALEAAGGWVLSKGKNFFEHVDRAAEMTVHDSPYHNFTTELFPKQTSIQGKGGFGNLMRLPLGRNLKAPKDPTFFVDLRTAFTDFSPMDPVEALTSPNIWEYAHELGSNVGLTA
jgi:hypothetical protein